MKEPTQSLSNQSSPPSSSSSPPSPAVEQPAPELITPGKKYLMMLQAEFVDYSQALTRAQLGDLLVSAFLYETYGIDQPPEDADLFMLYQTAKLRINRKIEKYREKSLINSKNAKSKGKDKEPKDLPKKPVESDPDEPKDLITHEETQAFIEQYREKTQALDERIHRITRKKI